MRKKFYILLSIILLILIFIPNSLSSINSQKPPGGDEDQREKPGKLYISISKNDIDLTIGNSEKIDVKLVAKEGDVKDIKLNFSSEINIEDQWLCIEFDDKNYFINEIIKIDELKKDQEKNLCLIISPNQNTKPQKYSIKLTCEPLPEKIDTNDTIYINIFRWGNIEIEAKTELSRDNPVEVGLNSEENVEFDINLEEGDNLKFGKFELILSLVNLPGDMQEGLIDWIYVNEKNYTIGDKFELLDLSKGIKINFKPPYKEKIDFTGDYEFKLTFTLENGEILNSEDFYIIYLKVVKYGKLNIATDSDSIEVLKNDTESLNVNLSAEGGDIKSLNISFQNSNNIVDKDWITIFYDENSYKLSDSIFIPVIKKDEIVKLTLSINPKDEVIEKEHLLTINFKSIKSNIEEKYDIKIFVKPEKLGKVDILNLDEDIRIYINEKDVSIKFQIKATDGALKNVEFNLIKPDSFEEYNFSTNNIEKIKSDDVQDVELKIKIPDEIINKAKDFNEFDYNTFDAKNKYEFKLIINYNGTKKEARFFIKFNVKVLQLTLNSKIMAINEINKELDVPPQIIEGRTYLPIRWVAEPLGATVDWNGIEKKVTVQLKDVVIELWVGRNLARVNGNYKFIDPDNPKVVPLIIEGRTMLPIRFVAENLGCKVNWNPLTRTVAIIYFEEKD
ncbi:MAG TPA: copper amine oxidase N-terminal domain-containing protein [Caldisericia bacterium]|nr:copper amine oxidase N-terminal domain-containing protein [Caldisericia bacterium]